MERKIKFAQGEYYHLYDRGVEKRTIFIDHKDCERFMAILYIMNQKVPFNFANFLKHHKLGEIFDEDREKPLVSILSYTLMTNHFHLLVYEKEEGGISKFMMKVLTAYSMYFNTKYKRSGPLFVRPFRSEHIKGEAQYLWIFSYIHLNPLKIITNAEKSLKDYIYSSYLDYTSKKKKRPCSKILDFTMVPEFLRDKSYIKEEDYKNWLEKYEEKKL